MFQRAPSPGQLREGDRVGRYEIVAAVGEGAMGHVFRAIIHPDRRTVALKVLRAELAADETYQRRFLHEARAASVVRNRYLVPIIDAGVADDHHYLAFGFVDGSTLEASLREGPLAVDRIVRLATEIGEALDALHRHGIVHRDVKPSNIMVDREGTAVLTDFGLAKGEGYTVLTRVGQVMGTIDYLAPEMIRGGAPSPASDVYGLGCVLVECLSGAAPFASRSLFQVGIAHLEQAPPDPCQNRPDAPPELSGAVLSALAKDPEARPRSAAEYAAIVRHAAGAKSG